MIAAAAIRSVGCYGREGVSWKNPRKEKRLGVAEREERPVPDGEVEE